MAPRVPLSPKKTNHAVLQTPLKSPSKSPTKVNFRAILNPQSPRKSQPQNQPRIQSQDSVVHRETRSQSPAKPSTGSPHISPTKKQIPGSPISIFHDPKIYGIDIEKQIEDDKENLALAPKLQTISPSPRKKRLDRRVLERLALGTISSQRVEIGKRAVEPSSLFATPARPRIQNFLGYDDATRLMRSLPRPFVGMDFRAHVAILQDNHVYEARENKVFSYGSEVNKENLMFEMKV